MTLNHIPLILTSLFLILAQPTLVMSAESAGSLPLAQTTKNQDKQLEADRLLQQGTQQDRISQFEAAFQSWQQALKLYRDIKDRPGEGSVLGNLGNVSRNLGNYQKAIEFQEQSLAIAREFRDRLGEGASLSSLGNVYYSLGNYPKAIDFHQQSLTIKREIRDRLGEGQSLSNLGLAYYFLGNYPKAIDFHQQSLAIAREIRNRSGEGSALGNLGLVYRSLGNYPKAIESYEKSLVITREIKDHIGTGNALGNLGTIFFLLGNYPKAIEFHEKSLAIARKIKDRVGEGNSLSSLGNTYSLIGSYSKAIEFQQQCLVIAREIKDRVGEGNSLGNLGSIYGSLGNYPKAIEFHQQHLAITRELKDLEGEGLVLSNIGLTLVRQKQPELAVAFYKQSVNIRESIRQDNRKLSREEQQSYTQTVADNYRNLASLLLQQDRVMEALQVLDLLKVQELKDFFKDVKGNQRTAQGLEMLDEERQILNPLNSGLTLNLNRYLESPIVATLVQQLTKTAPKQNLKLAAYTDLQTRLQNLGTDSALLYPLVLPDRIELVLFTQNAPPVHHKVAVSQVELEQTIKSFRSAIQRPNAPDIKQPANQLYSWLIKPLEADLQQANIKTLIYAPDGQMRYIPLAALYDGQHWLVEKYQVNYITALSLTKFDQSSSQPPRILAGAFTDPGATVNLSGQTFSFTAIPFAKPEVENLAKQFPNTTQFLGRDFSHAAMTTDRLNGYNIIHLATHGKLVSGTPEDSFILLNNQEYITLREIKDWKLPNVELVVLSACQTALGDKLGNGIEIIGFGYQLQQAQARASISTLWEINDGSTSELMKDFYQNLSTGKMNKVEALRQAQLALLGNRKPSGKGSRGDSFRLPNVDGSRPSISTDRSNPYYWAPFILIGNGL